MLLEESLRITVEQLIGETIQSVSVVGGGDINEAHLIRTRKHAYFLKINESKDASPLLETEVKGLALLDQVCTTPKIYGQQPFVKGAFLLMEYIEPGIKDNAFWVSFGQELAALHNTQKEAFGLDHNNFIGSLPQSNQLEKDWPDFYIKQRLQPQVKLAFDNNLFSKGLLPSFDKLYLKLSSICPTEKASLIHGDLWSGNFLVREDQRPVLIDPSVSYAHREMDLAMSLLFGGFSNAFYESYHNYYPLEPGFKDRTDIYQLYYLLVHVNLFGQSYVGAVERIVRRYVA